MKQPRMIIFDANNWFRRRAEASTTGTPIRDCYNEVLRLSQNATCVVVWDGFKSLEARRKIYPAYKEKRNKPGNDFFESQKLFQKILEFSAATQVKVDGYEGDDVVAAIATRYRDYCDISISSNDGDLWQLGLPMDREKFPEEPHRVALYKTMVGDPSDNIGGAKGFGKGAWAKLTNPQKDMLHQIIASSRSMTAGEITEKVADFYPNKALAWFTSPEGQSLLKTYYSIVNFLPVPWDLIEKNMKAGLNQPTLANPIFEEYML